VKNEPSSSSHIIYTPLKAKTESLAELKKHLKITLEKSQSVKKEKSQRLSDDEEKYDVKDEKFNKISEKKLHYDSDDGKVKRKKKKNPEEGLHYDSEEERVKRREKKAMRDEEETFDSESDDETHLDSYIHWLEKREKIFSYKQYKYKYYKSRYSLLSPAGRKFEWLRFGFLTGFPVTIYGLTIHRWFNAKKEQVGLQAKGRNYRKVSDRALQIPQMSYDNRDMRIKIKNENEEDLYANPKVYENLPFDLRVAPAEDASEKMQYSSVEEYVKNMFSVKKLRSKLLYVQQDLYSSSSSSSDSENDLEHFECATCGVIPYKF
jgi:hypothetical protein